MHTRAPRILARVIGAIVLVALSSGIAESARADDDPLNQTLSSEESIATDDVTLSTGHVDVGPKFVDGHWTIMIHDDAARAGTGGTSVWRHTDRTVLMVEDAALLTVPDDDAYDFLGRPAGSEVYVVPQTQDPSVVWVGWNTQDPEVMSRIDRGVTFTLDAVSGPGDVLTYLQSGNFGAPNVLWDSRKPGAQPAWVDVNTHTHANWVFTEPGVYLATFTVGADLVDGTTVTDTRALRFAVGSTASATDALAAAEPVVRTPASSAAAPTAAESSSGADDSFAVALVITVVVVVVLLLAGLVLVVVLGGRAKRKAMEE
jgi:putative ABC transporter-associated repeat protein